MLDDNNNSAKKKKADNNNYIKMYLKKKKKVLIDIKYLQMTQTELSKVHLNLKLNVLHRKTI